MDSAPTVEAADAASDADADADAGAPGGPPGRTGGRWSTLAWLLCSALLVALVVGIWLRVGTDRSAANLANAIIAGERPPAPELPSETLPDSGTTGLPSWYRSDGKHQVVAPGAKVLVVNWWASWCAPCKEEAPVLVEIADDYEGRVVVVGLNASSQDLESDARRFARRYEYDFTVVRGDRSVEDAWAVGGFPETFVVGTDGRISSFVNGPIDEETLRGLLDTELAEDRA